MRLPSRGATSQKLLIFAVLLATSIRQILRPVQARTLLPSLGSFNGDDNNTGYSRSQDETSSAEVFNGTQLFPEEEVVELTNSTLDLEEREEEPSSSYVLVVVQTANLELLHRELLSFEQLFSTSKFRRKVRFRRWKDMATFERWLADPAIATVLYAASTPGDVDEDGFNTSQAAGTDGGFIGFCDSLSTHLSARYGKPVLFWPCPRMKQTDKFVPSYETVSFAVKSISQQFNWTEATLFAPDANWALPLALAISLPIPTRIVLDGEELVRSSVPDKAGSVIIVCSSINSPHTIATIRRLRTLRRTKLLLLDTAGQTTIFDGSSGLYRSLGRHDAAGRLNLLVLTALTERFKHALNAVHGIDLTSNYERLSERLLKIRLDDDSGLEEGPANDIRRGSSGWNVRVEWLAGVINSANLSSSSCDFNYLQTSATEEMATLAHVDHDRCRTLLESYCGVDETTYGNSSFQFENASDSEELVRQQQQVDINRLCTVLRKNRDLLVENSTNPAKRLIFSANFHLYEYILAVARNEPHLQQKFDFVVFDLQNVTAAVWRPLLIVRQDQLDWQRFTMHPVQPGYGDWMVASVATIESLWICGLLCWAVIGVMVFMVVSIVCASVVFSIAVRNYLLKTRLSKGPNKIVLSPSDFVFPVDMRRVDEGIEAMLCCWLQQLQEFGGPEVEKPDLLKGSIGSLKNLGLPAANTTSAATTTKTGSGSGTLVRPSLANAAGPVGGTGGGPGSGIGGGYGGGYGGIGGALEFKARYNGDLVQLKEIPSSSSGSSSSQELKNRAMDLLVMAHGLRHENINPLIGWLNEPTRTALVFEHCSRGSLQDVLIMDEIKLDWTFRLSLLTDLVRGMRYLHGSPIRVHGSLSSRNCVVDARWVLKITDYGIPGFFEAQGLVAPTKSAKDLLWTAPEALRAAKGYPRCGTQAADVYSFGIIMQEVVVRGEPFCMLSLAPEEIITKIKKPPPLIRPSVSKGAAPPEAINIMRQCWAESPEMRPDFVTICERFKQLNHGRKVNFVDTMFQMLEKYSNNLEELIRERTEQLDVERKKTEQLLNRMLPSSVADRLKLGLAVEPEEFAEVTIYFSDIVGFTTIAAHCTPVQVVDLLNDLYTCFDATINAYNVYKVETIGDAYMVVGGLPVRTPDHAEQIATMALDLLHQSGNFKVRHLPGVPLQLRIGLHTGPCCAGVVGLTMPRYCLFGDTVNTASRMESTGSSWRIHMSPQTCNLLEQAGGYVIEPRGPIEIKGKGKMHTYWLLGKKGFDKVLPTPPPIGESHGLDIAILRKSLFQSEQNNQQQQQQYQHPIVSVDSHNGGSTTANHSSSHSPSVAGESIDVKVEITPPMASDNPPLMASISIDSGSSNANYTLNMGDFGAKTPLPSPQARKLSEIVSDTTFLSANSSFNRLNPSPPGSSSTRLFKRIEEMIDLSSPYNYYKCLSPSESNLSQCHIDGRFHGYQVNRMDCSSKPGSTRFLRRQFSLDKDDVGPSMSNSQKATLDTISSISIDRDQLARMGTLSSIPSISSANSVSMSASKQQRTIGIHKQQSASVAQDLEKIEEIPLSPQSQFLVNHNTTNSNSTSSLQSDVNEKARSAQNGKELCLSIEALGLR